MSFPAYPHYRDSGVEWLGDVPEHWEVYPLKRHFNVTLGKMLQNEPKSPDDVLRPYLRAANIKWGGADLSEIKSMWFSPAEVDNLTLESGDLLVSEGGDVGRSALWREEITPCHFQNSVNRVRSRGNARTDFLGYWMSVIKAQGYVDILCNKSTIAHFTAEKVAAVMVPIPSAAEQTAIAAFLDRETAKIDALVEEQRRLIDLLKEKRQAVISHAVTKGLDTTVPMKDSGVEWLGEIPAHWEIKRLKNIAKLNPPKSEISNTPDDMEVSFLPMEAISERGELDLTRTRPIAEVRNGYSYFADKDVVFAKVTPCFENGKGALMAELVGGFGFGTTELTVLRPKDAVDGAYMWWVTSSILFRSLGVGEMQGAGGLKRVPDDFTATFPTPWPPLGERQAIVQSLASQSAVFDALTSKAQQAITLLQERRAALISAAVTGKIDVRGLAPQQAEAA